MGAALSRLQEGRARCCGILCRIWLSAALWALCVSVQAQADVDATALLSARPSSGVLVLHSDYRDHPYIDANVLLWLGAPMSYGLRDRVYGDVVTVNVDMGDPQGWLRGRAGRFILATGAVRPVHLDGLWLRSRLPWGARAEVFGGVPVADGLERRGYDWFVGGRVAQGVWEDRFQAGLSYVQQRDQGQVANEEVGADLRLQLSRRLWLTAVGAWDLVYRGLATFEARATWQSSPQGWLVRGVALRRVAARLLPATSLFSTISDSASSEVGGELHVPLFPRLSVGGLWALQWQDGLPASEYGYRATARARLRLDAKGAGAVTAELSRRGGFEAGYSALYLGVEQALNEQWSCHGAGELVMADHGDDVGHIWPWLNLGLRWDAGSALYMAAAFIARSSPQYVAEYNALLRVGFHAGSAP